MKSQEGASPSSTQAALAWSGDGRLLAYCSEPGRIVTVSRVDDATARERGAPIETDLVVDALALSHDGEWLAVGGSGTVALWWHDAARQHPVEVTRAALPGNQEVRIELAFAPDSRVLAVAQGSHMLLLRLDLEALRPKLRPSTLRIRAESTGKRWDFVLDTPAGQLTLRHEARPELDAESLMSQLRPALVVIDPESHNDNATPAERLDFALAPLRRRLLPTGLGESPAMGATDHAIVLDLDPALAAYPWELLLTGRGAAPLAVTHGLVRMRAQAADALLLHAADAPMHTLLLSAVGAAHETSSGSSDLDHAQAARLAETVRDAGEPQGLIDHRSRITARQAIEALLERDWRLLVLVGTPSSEGEMELGDGTMLGHREVRAMRRAPDAVLLLGGDFRRQAALMREAGVAVCIASGWPMNTDSLWCFFSELLRAMRGGEPLTRAVQMARQYAHTRSAGTAWALEVHGDPLATWPELPMWRKQAAQTQAEPEPTAKQRATTAVPEAADQPEGQEFLVSGRVQGVGFRAFAQQHARELGLQGTAENLPDGRVRVRATGPAVQLAQLASRLRQGPPHAKVDDVIAVRQGTSGAARGTSHPAETDGKTRAMSRIWFAKGLRGMIAKHIQSDLLRAGFTAGPLNKFVDGNFGANTETALKALQARRGLLVNGGVDVETWQELTADPLPTLFERCLGVTTDFEGHGFGLVHGNFDGAGLTWGVIGFTLKSQEIQALLAETEAAEPGTLARVLGRLAVTWQGVVRKPLAEQIAWADSISSGPRKTRVPQEWKDAFARLGDEAVVKRLQMQRAYDRYFVPCSRSAGTLGLRSELGIELAFDVHVQNGSFGPQALAMAAALPANTPEVVLRHKLANAVADSANPRWAEDVRKRKLVIAEGRGTVNGREYALEAWGLSGNIAAT